MSYIEYDESVKNGRPFWLYQFASGATTNYFTSDRYSITRQSHVWTPKAIVSSEIEENGNVERNELQLTFGLNDDFAIDFMIPRAFPTTITVFRGFHEDPDEELSVRWKGRILGASSNDLAIEMKCENIFTSLRRVGCRVRVQRMCRHSVYSASCGALLSGFDTAATITGINGLALTVPAAAGLTAGILTNGMVKWNNIYGQIELHSSSVIRLVTEIPGLEEALEGGSQACTLYDGCDRSLTGAKGCRHFARHLSYGGFRNIPNQNIFNSSLI